MFFQSGKQKPVFDQCQLRKKQGISRIMIQTKPALGIIADSGFYCIENCLHKRNLQGKRKQNKKPSYASFTAYSTNHARHRPTYPSRVCAAEFPRERKRFFRFGRWARASPDADCGSRSSSARRCSPARRQTATRATRAEYPRNGTRLPRWKARRADRRCRADMPRLPRFAADRDESACRGWTPGDLSRNVIERTAKGVDSSSSCIRAAQSARNAVSTAAS